MAKKNSNGKDSKTVQATLKIEEYKSLLEKINCYNTDQHINISESAYIRKLILEDVKKGDSS
jgi:hypothetical protein